MRLLLLILTLLTATAAADPECWHGCECTPTSDGKATILTCPVPPCGSISAGGLFQVDCTAS